jgi:hypothetical protein
MKKIAYLAIALFIVSPVLTSCRDENTIEVEKLEPDADDSADDEGYDTNPTESDPD